MGQSLSEMDAGLISALYETVGNPAGWQPFLETLVATYPGGKGGFVLHDHVAQQGGLEVGAGWAEEDLSAYHGYFSKLNPWIANIHKAKLGVAYNADMLFSRQELKKTEFHADWLRPTRVGTGNGVVLQHDPSRVLVMTVLYPERTDECDSDAVGRVQRIAPHVLRVAQINRQLALLETRANVAERGQSGAMLVVTAKAELLHVNQAGDQLVVAAAGLRLAGTVVEAGTPAETSVLHRLINEAARALGDIDAAPGGIVRLSRKCGRVPLEVMVTPAPHRLPRGALGSPMAVLFVKDPDERLMASADVLRRRYGLTRAEARLMAALMTQDTIETAAERFGVSRETLRTQLKGVFQKTGTNTQLELVRLGLGSAVRHVAASR